MSLEPSRRRADYGCMRIAKRLVAIKQVLLMDEKDAFVRLFIAEVRLFRRFPLPMHLLALAILSGFVYFLWAYTRPVYAGAGCGLAVAYGASLEFLVRHRRRRQP
jgi:hypothetical protein